MRLASHHTVRRRAAQALADGPLSTDDLVQALVASGVELGDQPADALFDALEGDDDLDLVPPERWVHRPSALDGQRWWVDVTVDADDVLHLPSTFHALDSFRPVTLSWATPGGGVETHALMVHHPDGVSVIAGPSGWLSHVAGRAAVLSFADGMVRIEPATDAATATSSMCAAVTAMFDVHVRADDAPAAHTSHVVHDALLVDPASFRGHVVPADADLAVAAGFELHGEWMARPGYDWAAHAARRRTADLAGRHQLDDHEVAALVALLDATQAIAPGTPPPAELGSLAAALVDPELCRALAFELRAAGDDTWIVAGETLHTAALDGPTPGGAAWVYATALDTAGRVDDAIAVLDGASADDHHLVLLELAGHRADAGDAAGAAQLLQRAGATAGDDSEAGDLAREIEPFAVRPRPTAERNDPCPCGSGRKYKVCHAGREGHSLDDRAAWLHQKAVRWVFGHDDELLVSVASTLAEAADGDEQLLADALASPLVSDIALHEGGAFDDFLAQRGHRLPDDEALLAAQWQLVDRSIHEVVDVGPREVVLRDLRSGEVVSVTGLQSTELVEVGRRVLARPLPVPGGWRSFFGLVPVSDRLVPEALELLDEPSPEGVADLIGRCFAPPVVTNSDGQQLRFHELRWKVANPGTVDERLRAAGLHASGPRWTLLDDHDSILATLALRDDLLAGEANSDERAALLEQLVADALPDADLVDDDVRDLWELEADDDEPPTGEIDYDGPEMREALRAFTLGYEQRWLDEEIPALGGLTPRQAAVDPIGRRDLERLLSQMPDVDDPGAMSPARLREALGL